MDYTWSLPSVTENSWKASFQDRSEMSRKTLVSHSLPKCLHYERSYHYLQCFVFTSVMVLNITYLRVSSKVYFNRNSSISVIVYIFQAFLKNQSWRVKSESMHFTRWTYQHIFIKIFQHVSIKILLFPITVVSKTTVL